MFFHNLTETCTDSKESSHKYTYPRRRSFDLEVIKGKISSDLVHESMSSWLELREICGFKILLSKSLRKKKISKCIMK